MGTKQTKGSQPSHAAESPQHHLGSRRKTPGRDRGDIFASFMLKSNDKFAKSGTPPPYQRRIAMIQDMLLLVKQGKQEEATELLKNLRQDLGMESTSLDDVLYRYASFRNLVDPITHDLIISLARYIHCPKQEGDSLVSMEKVCRQLTYHLSPHSQWRRQGLMKKKPQACLKAVLCGRPPNNTVDLSGIPLTMKDMDRVGSYLQHNSEHITNVELCFTELTDDMFLSLLSILCNLPHLTTLSLNGNRLTKAILRELTETLKNLEKFPNVTWIDLGNNVDIFSLPQPFLVSLRKRCPKQGNLPTILEFGEGQVSDLESHDENLMENQENLFSVQEEQASLQLIKIESSKPAWIDVQRSLQMTPDEQNCDHVTTIVTNQT
ncbi:leucine-rich repeat-containing protein 75A [Latimeria chalumnae]|uniref:leucine-rich repeat-containing protein 75A n=1 Tax=Latimeria chalumnae TaxID=7897 RepID=UPI0003C1A88B|nr:PREDICTED: leucine-rich repeat-containing protein 75A [Latimeria chalumnae]XP_005987565.1 PREDICTED: leucine-rich repeat-containing protein 75A [Latimeria chalumnae]|eukprot:XP_005987564.1 PREDICTED: leucine-rich repeat-containing protein 75A [Latimeria chalumnae]